ncbi:MAG: FG-GAP repeat domain-containing protein [Planctomycetota bacterium]
MRSQQQLTLSLAALLSSAVGLAQDSRSLLHAPTVLAPLDTRFLQVFDGDGDGDMDVLAITYDINHGTLRVYRNDGGALVDVWSEPAIESNNGQLPVAVADFDGDGRDDFVVAGRATAIRYTAQPGFQFQKDFLVQAVTQSGKRAVAAGDFDNDGAIDVAVAADNGGNLIASLDVFLASGTTLTEPLPTNFFTSVQLESLDLDGGGGVDLLYSDSDSGTAYAYVVNGGQLQTTQSFAAALPPTFNNPFAWTGGDLDGDGDTDLVCFRRAPGTNGVGYYRVFERTGAATFSTSGHAIGGPAERLVDIDGDGDLDGVGYGLGGTAFHWSGLSIEISINDGSGAFAPAWTAPGTGSGKLAGVADIDSDGDVDIVASRFVFWGDGPWDREPMPFAGGKSATTVFRSRDFDDLDRDGDTDMGPFLINRGDGQFTTVLEPVTPPAGFSLGPPEQCDVDGDGHLDRLMGLYIPGSPPQFQHMVWAQNNGANHFHYIGACSAPGVEVGNPGVSRADNGFSIDLDGDGDQERIYNQQSQSGIGAQSQVFWNNNQTFSPGTLWNQISGGRVDQAVDFDNDGLLDLLMSGVQNGLHVRRATGVVGAWFVTSWNTPRMPFEPAAMAIGDLNDDGRVDFVRPNSSGELVLFLNQSTGPGNIAFASYPLVGEEIAMNSSVPSPARRASVTIADLDQDGKTDIAFGPIPGAPNVGIVLRRLSWSTPPTLANYDVVRQAFLDGFAADGDADGDADLIGTLMVQNRRYHGASAGRRVQRYEGVAGEDGAVPVLGATGPFRVGETEVLTLTGVPGPTVAVLGISLGEQLQPNVPLPGLTLHLDLATTVVGTLPIPTDGQGRAAASASLPIQLVQGLQGVSFYVQAFVLDAAAPQGVSSSGLLVKTIGG